jgi:predicted metalloprotease
MRHHRGALGVAEAVLLGPHAAHGHRVHELEVAGVEAEREVHLRPVRVMVRAVAQVVLHVAAADVQLGIGVRELAEDLRAGSCP